MRVCVAFVHSARVHTFYTLQYLTLLHYLRMGSSADGGGSDPEEGEDWSRPRGGWTHPRFGGQLSATTMMEETSVRGAQQGCNSQQICKYVSSPLPHPPCAIMNTWCPLFLRKACTASYQIWPQETQQKTKKRLSANKILVGHGQGLATRRLPAQRCK